MTQWVDPLPCIPQETILCRYVNATCSVQIACLTHHSGNDIEKALFPGDCLVFRAEPDAYLEIYTPEICSALLAERIWCSQLRFAPSAQP